MNDRNNEQATPPAIETQKSGIWATCAGKIGAFWKRGLKGKALGIGAMVALLLTLMACGGSGGGSGGDWKYTGEYFYSVFEGFPKDEGVVYRHFPRPLDEFGLLGSLASLSFAAIGSSTDSYLVPIKVMQATKNGNLVEIEECDRVVWVETKRHYEDNENLDEGYYIRRGSYEYTTALGVEKTVARYVEVSDKGILAKIQKQIEEEKAAAEAKAKAEREAAEAKAKAEREAEFVKAKAEIAAMPAGTTAGETRTIVLPGGVELAMVWCPQGTFTMGSSSDEGMHYDDQTQHQVTLTKGFWMGKTEVTQAQWKSVVGNNPSNNKGDDLPVEGVSWNDCQEFCEKTGLQLPTEAQWEYACRSGSTGSYAGSGNLYEMGWYGYNSGRETHPVGTKQPNAWGLCDMHGNVWEWCADWKDYYPTGAVTDPTGPDSGSTRVYRGGSWDADARSCRSTFRDGNSPDVRDGSVGFRPVKIQP